MCLYESPEIKPLNKSFCGLIAMATMCINAKKRMYLSTGLTGYLHGMECFPVYCTYPVNKTLYSFKKSHVNECETTFNLHIINIGCMEEGV